MTQSKSSILISALILSLIVSGCAIGVAPTIDGAIAVVGNEGIKYLGKQYIYQTAKEKIHNDSTIPDLINQTNRIKRDFKDLSSR